MTERWKIPPPIIAIPIFLVVGIAGSFLAFSPASRQAIIQRDKRCMKNDSSCQGILEAAHLNHDKTDKSYDNPNNGLALCTYHHLLDHIFRTNNGLKRSQNNWAIERIRSRLLEI